MTNTESKSIIGSTRRHFGSRLVITYNVQCSWWRTIEQNIYILYEYISGLKSFTYTRFIQLPLTVNIYILIALFVIMVGTSDFVCCEKRISTNDRQPVNMNSF